MIVRVITGRDTDEAAVFDAVAKAYADRDVTTVIVHKRNAYLREDGTERMVDLSKRLEPVGGC